LLSGAAALYLCAQLIIPWLVIARDEPTSRDFAWDMFSYTLSCSELAVVVQSAPGEWETVLLAADFKSWAQLRRALSLSRFERYAAGLCDALQRERRRPVQLYLRSACRGDRNQPSFGLIDPERDFCQRP
jgi:hypothetical protein